HDSIRKYALYKEAGVREFWLVDPHNNIVTVCNFTGTDYEPARYSFTDPIPVGIFADLSIDLSEFVAE
ncbi:MAG: Uma2 family endonuclease, partial [Lachnospiraceae bacterium]|nr:Uma2 family endonuclease [Lachnospiraceae bacterium]